MADYNPRYNRGGYGRYKKDKNFIAMEAGTDAFFLEDEANELQWIQNELRADIIRRKYYSGIYSKTDEDDIILSSSIFDTNQKIFNSFLVKPMTANINGYFIDVLGTNGFNNNGNSTIYKDLNYIVLPPPPEEGEYYDFIYLEMAFAELKHTDDLWHFGNRNNSYGIIENDLFDKRINGETNRRIQLKWNIYSARVAMNSENAHRDNGGMFDEQTFCMYVPAHGGYFGASSAGFIYAPNHPYYKSDDKGLWIAGNGLKDIQHQLYSSDGYSYAIPLFKVIRRNTKGYYSDNLYGSENIIEGQDSFSTRPDGKFANIIYKDDIIDLRNLINPESLKNIMRTNFENVLLNEVKEETKLYSTSFGLDNIKPDADTVFYEPCNIESFDEELLQGNQLYEFAPGLEQEGIIFDRNTYIKTNQYIKNASINGLTLQFVLKVPLNNNEYGLFTIKNSNDDTVWLYGYIQNKNLYIVANDRKIIYPFKEHYNKFTHLAIAAQDKRVQLIVNNKIIETITTTDDIAFDDYTCLMIGYVLPLSYYSSGILFDEIELSKVFENQFSRIPAAVTQGNAEFAIDTQYRRANYSKFGDEDTYTFHVNRKSNNEGILDFYIDLPYTVNFTNIYPTIYFDNESIQVDQEVTVNWKYERSNRWRVTISGLGAEVTYNLVIIAPVNYPGKQGIGPVPKKAHLLRAEKCDTDFMAVQDLSESIEHEIPLLNQNDKFVADNKLVTYNPYLTTNGFLNTIKYQYMLYNSDIIKLPKHIYTDIISIYAVMLNGVNIMNDFHETEDEFVINLINTYNANVEIYLVTKFNAVVYSPTKGGIENLFRIEEINDYGNGSKRTFIYRSTSKIMSLLSARLRTSQYYIVYVDNVPKRVSITIDGAFVHYTFDTPPVNKANIRTYIVSEYDPLRSERLEFFYEVSKVDNSNQLNKLGSLDNADIIYHENEIFVTTDGYGLYPSKEIMPVIQEALPISQGIKPDDDEHTVHGDTVIDPGEEMLDRYNNSVYTEKRASASTTDIASAPFSVTDEDDNEYSAIRFVTEKGIVSASEYHRFNEYKSAEKDKEITVHSSNLKYSYNMNEEDTEIPLFKFSTDMDVHSLDEDELDQYKVYMLNKKMVNLDLLPAVERLEFMLSPSNLLKTRKCDIIFDSSDSTHIDIVTKEALPVSTNLSAMINYVVPLNGYSLLTTFNKLVVMNTATQVFNGISKTSIDGKSFYSLTQLDEACQHVNVFPFLINDGILKLGILTTYCEDKSIYIDVNTSAFGLFNLNNRYLLKKAK